MSPQDQQFWNQQFDKIKLDWNNITDKLLVLVEKSAQHVEGSKNELAGINSKLDKPFYSTFGFYQLIASILLVVFFGALLYQKGGEFEAWGVKYNSCKQ